MQSWGSIIDALGGTGEVATALALSDSTVSSWREPRAIPAGRWEAIVRLATEKGVKEITLEVLAALAAERRPKRVEPADARA